MVTIYGYYLSVLWLSHQFMVINPSMLFMDHMIMIIYVIMVIMC